MCIYSMCAYECMHFHKCLKTTRLNNFVKVIQLANCELGVVPRLSDSEFYILTGILYSFLWIC